MNIVQSGKIDIHEGLWTPPPTLENPTEHEGKSIKYTRMKLLERKQKINSTLSDICIIKYPVPIPLCRMIGMEVIRPALDDDVAILSRSFLNGYIPGSASFYVSVEHEEGYTIDVDDDIVNQWDEIWKQKNEEFEAYLTEHGLHAFKNKMFHIWDGNHRFKAWYNTKEMKLGGVEYHISPTSIILDGRKENHSVITCLCDDINM
jgi:hypothetical protein